MRQHIIIALISSLCTGCFFTGVESTQKVSEKEVSRALSELERKQPSLTLTTYNDSVPSWRPGKRFFVTDNQVRLIFNNITTDSISLAGTCLVYDGFESGSVLDNRETLNLKFLTQDGKTLIFRTGKTLEQFSSTFSIPLLIDMDMVEDANRQLQGKEVYIKTSIWYDPESGEMKRGRQFVKVKIERVEPGNKVLPLRVSFQAIDSGESAFLWMSSPSALMHNRDFDSMFSLRDIHDSYPDISASTWQLITNGNVAVGMNKEECRLALGAPKRISRLPDQTGLREYWYYDGGSYLFFVDGLLNQFRK